MKYFLTLLLTIFIFTGCGSSSYYQAVTQNNKAYLEQYSKVENEKVSFLGTFDGNITIVRPKQLPVLQHVQKPKTSGDYLLQTLGVLAPVGLGIAGYHYNYKSTDSSNKYNAQTMESWTSNFENTSINTNTDTDTISNTVTNSDTIKEIQTLPNIYLDSNSTSIGN
jgi:hypothetical protein